MVVVQEKDLELVVAQEPSPKELQNLVTYIFSVEVVDASNRLTPKGAVRDAIDLKVYIESKPEYGIKIVAYAGTIYSVEVYSLVDGAILFLSPKSSVGDVCDWIMTDAKITPSMASHLKKMILPTRKQALSQLPKLGTVE